MAERIDLPKEPKGTAEQQVQQMYRYLYQLATILNVNQLTAGSEAVTLTDEERVLMNSITQAGGGTGGSAAYMPANVNYAEAETLKSLIIKTAQCVKTEMDNYRMVLFGEESAQSDFGTWNRKKGLRVDVTPDGIKQTFSYAEIVKGLKDYEINAKSYIKTGYLHDDDQELPVYGVAIGKDIVTFSEDGSETYVDGNKVAELTADELAFFQNEQKVASYTGNKLSFYNGGQEIMYIQNGKIYMAKGMEITSDQGIKMTSSGFVQILGKGNSIIQLVGGTDDDQTIFQADSDGVVQAKSLNSSDMTAADITVNHLRVTGSMETPSQQFIISTTRPQDVHDIIWLEPAPGIEPYNVTQNVADGQTLSAWTDKGVIAGWQTWEQTCLVSGNAIDAEGATRIRISGNLYKNGSTSSWNAKLLAKVNISNSVYTEFDLEEVGSFPNQQSLKWNYGFNHEKVVDIPLEQGAAIYSVTFQLKISNSDHTADYSYTNSVKLTVSGEKGSGQSDECTVHYIP